MERKGQKVGKEVREKIEGGKKKKYWSGTRLTTL